MTEEPVSLMPKLHFTMCQTEAVMTCLVQNTAGQN